MTEVSASRSTVVFAGGGSGGHLSPGIAVSEAIESLAPGQPTLFICSERTIDREVLSGAARNFQSIPARPALRRPGAFIRFLLSIPRATAASASLLKAHRVGVVVLLGGFVSYPVARAARQLGIPMVLLNLDAVSGRANRRVARWTDRVLSAVPTVGLGNREVAVVGMPIRRAARAGADPEKCRERLALRPDLQTLLITGASQGSTSLNEALPRLLSERRELLRGWQVLHLTGSMSAERSATLKSVYAAAEIPAVTMPFLHDMGLAWGAASLAISRAGASSVAEAAFNRVPAIFVPFPHHRDQHQRHNAEPLVRQGSACLARDPVLGHGPDPDLGHMLDEVLGDQSRLRRLESAARGAPQVDAAAKVAALVLGLNRGLADLDR
ncbi:MAG: UDP-N-acetylglucosamine--N-acetylmuramyl-(pentapeptide) pyrophosphoryl-undecaprenol N-acetylglucosamine transferase [Phycisphaeraceae bacterium]|nr:UDP-N-acetylglucosamine--N-acetylmuramyl-(pentapeptide) pyrophosphoryl-undecaprenol N-acetylglucosamine transferase [Phycisphaeraceae bacterium]